MAFQQALLHTLVAYKNYTCSGWCVFIVGGPGPIANCRPLRCPVCRTKATWVAASAAASCFTVIQKCEIYEHKLRFQPKTI